MMALPAGVSTFDLLYGKTYDFEGTSLRTDVTVFPSHEIVWAATGERLTTQRVSSAAGEGEFGTIELPHTDQAGFVDTKGNAITNWWYTVQSTDFDGQAAAAPSKTRKIQATSDVAEVDLDLIPAGTTVGPIGSVPLPAITSVNGQTGAVTVTADLSSVVPLSQVAAASGVASLDGTTKVPVAQIPVQAIAVDPILLSSYGSVVGTPRSSGPEWTRQGVFADLTDVTAPFDSLYWPWVVKVAGIGTPLNDYYLYYSTDHQNGQGGIGLMHGPSPLGPWTDHGLVYQDTVAGRQTETPSVIYAPDLDAALPFFMYYQQDWVTHPGGVISIPSGVIGAQSTLLAQSANGITWTRHNRLGDGSAASGVVLDAYSGSSQTGNAHSGYFSPMRVGKSIAGPSLFGGGDYPGFAYWVSNDGKLFERSQRKLGYNVDLTARNLAGRLTSWNHSMVIEYRGELWWVGVVTNFSSGGAAKDARICQARLAPDRMTLLSEPEVIISGAGAGESVNIRSMSVYVEGGVGYLYYQCDNSFLVATCGGL